MQSKLCNEKTERSLWQNYRNDPCSANRETLILHYLRYVKYICNRIMIELPYRIKQEDLVGSGVMGLIDAIEKFKPDQGAVFHSYAFKRIRGAILDELRNFDWAPRAVRQEARSIKQITDLLEQKYSRKPSVEEIAAEARMKVEEVTKIYNNLSAVSVLSLEQSLLEKGESRFFTGTDSVQTSKDITPTKDIEYKESRELIARQIEHLPEKEKLIIILYYFEEMTLKEIGKTLNITESRVCQIHSKVMESMKKKIGLFLNTPLQK
ncbi:MAG: FliA/WhiG family RNA polymerase sigma factor [Candidatus Omnitrophota bacterium]|nr:MAG: FliA/WhiG family RNA polymerase sigma factor [Candidatus Omnitrophota bacterium]